MADGDVPLLRSRDYLPKGSGCDSNLRQLMRSLEDLRSNHRACLRAVTELRRDVRELQAGAVLRSFKLYCILH